MVVESVLKRLMLKRNGFCFNHLWLSTERYISWAVWNSPSQLFSLKPENWLILEFRQFFCLFHSNCTMIVRFMKVVLCRVILVSLFAITSLPLKSIQSVSVSVEQWRLLWISQILNDFNVHGYNDKAPEFRTTDIVGPTKCSRNINSQLPSDTLIAWTPMYAVFIE